ncbi:Claudin-3 [Lonchura striata]|uniref:sn-1-specific diacylglycerol lipase ABHD11 n=2 Tax=Passeriformes TaxID=9126 RepID=A0A218UFW9_9PASE|nr:Claudin-3 [Lonchura striata domestica]
MGLEIGGVALSVLGWLCSIICCALPMWKVSAFIGNNIVTAQILWEGLWMSCVVQSTGQMQCKVYDSMLALPQDLQAARALLVVAIILAVLGLMVAIVGAQCTRCVEDESTKAKITIVSGVIFLLSGVMTLIPVCWSANTIIRDFYNPLVIEAQKRELGTSLYVGWAASALLLLGGGLLCCSCPPKDDRYPTGKVAYSAPRSAVTSYDKRNYVLTVDARNHGSSPHSPVMTYEAMSLDVQHLLSRLGITKCILVGHSMGGKTAMTLALQRPDLVERLISVDIGPGSTAAVSEFSAYISAMKDVRVPAGLSRSAARQLADDQLQPVVKLRQFLLTNLVEVEGCYVWRVNLEAISRHLADIMNFPVFHKPYPGPALFLGGSDSPYISSRDYPEIQRLFPKAEIQYIKGAGHIVHQDKFEEFITAVLNFLPQL